MAPARARATFRALLPGFQAERITAMDSFPQIGNRLMRMLILIAFWLTAAAELAAAQAPSVTGVTVTRFGTYTAATKSAPARSGQESPTGTIGTDSDWHFEPDSLDVPAKPATHFGLEFRINGEPRDDSVTLYLTLIFPPQGIHNPNTGKTMYAARIAFPNMKIGALCLVGYGFDNAWEIVPGEWTEQIWYQDHMLAERKFTVGKVE